MFSANAVELTKMIIGIILKYNDENINTDVIWPGKYTYSDIPVEEMINHVFENYDADFKNKAKLYNVLVVGKNFGCGSSREQPAIALKNAGIKAIIAPSFSRIFYRNAINQGLPAIISQEIFDDSKTNDEISISLEEGIALINYEKTITRTGRNLPQSATILDTNKPTYGGAQTDSFTRVNKLYHIPKFPDFLMRILCAEGLVNYAKLEESE